jgi:hypothetical protein
MANVVVVAPNGGKKGKDCDWLSGEATSSCVSDGHNAAQLVIDGVTYQAVALPSVWCGPASYRSSKWGVAAIRPLSKKSPGSGQAWKSPTTRCSCRKRTLILPAPGTRRCAVLNPAAVGTHDAASGPYEDRSDGGQSA